MKKLMITAFVMILTAASASLAMADDDDWDDGGYYVQPSVNYYYPQPQVYYPQPQVYTYYPQPWVNNYYAPQNPYYGYNRGYRYGGYGFRPRHFRRDFDDDDD